MPNSEMRTFKFVTEKLGSIFSRDKGIMDSFNEFVRLERAEARREAIQDAIKGLREIGCYHISILLNDALAAPEKEETNG